MVRARVAESAWRSNYHIMSHAAPLPPTPLLAPAPAGNNFNSGVVLFKSSPTTFRFLKAAYMKMHNLNSPWWEQQSFIELLAEQ